MERIQVELKRFRANITTLTKWNLTMNNNSDCAKVVLITGAGIGIGRATAVAFAAQGYRVIVTDILEAEGCEVVSQIRESGGVAEYHPLNVRDTAACDRLVSDIEKKYGAIDTIVANAGIAHKVPLNDLTDEKWDLTFDIDLKGVFRVIRAAVPGMKSNGGGSIIAVSSIMGVAYGWDEHAHYSAAKSGVVGLVRGLAVELGRHRIRVNGIAPGFIRTAQALSEVHSLGATGLDKVASSIPLGRVGEPEEMADVITFMASHSARYLTGQTITVDGGLVVQSH
jgi:3-oxoacyl-[acyl-carrier protein] reductase